MYGIIIASVLGLGTLGVVFAVGLAIANAKLAVERNPLVDKILEALPGVNCGACGMAGCAAYAEAVAARKAPPDLCAPGGPQVHMALAGLLGVEVQEKDKRYAVVHCNRTAAKPAVDYRGLSDCNAAMLYTDAIYGCEYACLGLGTCAEACPFGAIVMSAQRLPVVIEEKCTGCGICASVCPKNIISIEKESSFVHILCRSRDKGAVARRNCQRACIGCGRCAKVCPVDAIEIKDFLAHIDYEKCVSCGKCVEECPTGAIANFRQMRRRKASVA